MSGIEFQEKVICHKVRAKHILDKSSKPNYLHLLKTLEREDRQVVSLNFSNHTLVRSPIAK